MIRTPVFVSPSGALNEIDAVRKVGVPVRAIELFTMVVRSVPARIRPAPRHSRIRLLAGGGRGGRPGIGPAPRHSRIRLLATYVSFTVWFRLAVDPPRMMA